MKKYKVLLIVSLLLLVAGCGAKTITETKKETVKKPTVEKYNLSLFMVGDALLHNGVYMDANTYKKDSNGYYIYDFTNMLTYIKDVVSNYDLAFYNQETIIGGKNLGLSNYPLFNSPDEIGLDMIKTGFNLVNLATNHTLDKGSTGATYSANFWESQKDVYKVGSYSSEEKRNEVVTAEKNGISYAMFGYTTLTNGIAVPTNKEYLVNVYDKEKVKEDIEKVKGKVDVVIVSMHWGTEYTHTPTDEQVEIANYLSSLGVDVVIGHHPHVIQPIEYVGNTLVFYSLGNFLSAQDGMMKRVGMMGSLEIDKTVKDGKSTIKINKVKGDLIYTYHQYYKNFKVIPFNKLDNTKLNGYQSIYDQYKTIINETNDSRIQTGF